MQRPWSEPWTAEGRVWDADFVGGCDTCSMRWLLGSLSVLLVGVVAVAIFVVGEGRKVEDFCSKLTVGTEIADVRRAVPLAGLAYKIEAFAQMRIYSEWFWAIQSPECRAFFNEARTLEYRHFENRLF